MKYVNAICCNLLTMKAEMDNKLVLFHNSRCAKEHQANNYVSPVVGLNVPAD